MSFHSWLQNFRTALTPGWGQRHLKRRSLRRAGTQRPPLEVLEDRLNPSFVWGGTDYSVPPGVVWSPQPPLLADVTSDGIGDQINLTPYEVVVRPGRANGTFGDPIRSGSQNAYRLAVADFNDDGRLDVFTLNYPSSWGVLAGQTWGSVLLGRGDGTFSYSGDYGFGGGMNGATMIGFGDILCTGRTDVVIAGYDYSDESVYTVLLNIGDWEPSPPPPPIAPNLSIDDVTVREGNAGAVSTTLHVSLSAASFETITVDYATAADTATAGSDYQSASGRLTFAPGETSKTVSVLVNGDRIGEVNETFAVNLTGATNASIADAQGAGTIVDDEPRISISDVTKSEGKKNQTTLFTFTVTLSAAYDQAVTVSFQTVNGTATTGDNDYVARTGTLTFAPGETTKTITINVNGDSKREAHEAFYLDLFNNSSNSLLSKYRGIGTIFNDD